MSVHPPLYMYEIIAAATEPSVHAAQEKHCVEQVSRPYRQARIRVGRAAARPLLLAARRQAPETLRFAAENPRSAAFTRRIAVFACYSIQQKMLNVVYVHREAAGTRREIERPASSAESRLLLRARCSSRCLFPMLAGGVALLGRARVVRRSMPVVRQFEVYNVTAKF